MGMEVLTEALELLGRTGYGADASVGHGAFEPSDEPTPCPDLDDVLDADGFISLSTFQPASTDPSDGFWRVFVKYGKLAPEFHGSAVFKRPQNNVLRDAMRDGTPTPGWAVGYRRTLEDALARLPDRPHHELRRGIVGDLPAEVTDLAPGDMARAGGFLSSSLGKGYVGPVQFVVDGRSGKEITGISAFTEESEVLFKPGTLFRVTGREERRRLTGGSALVIRIEEVTGGADLGDTFVATLSESGG